MFDRLRIPFGFVIRILQWPVPDPSSRLLCRREHIAGLPVLVPKAQQLGTLGIQVLSLAHR
jgi:hypothetical protein